MSENSDFEQNYWSRTGIGIHKTGHDSFRILKWLVYYDRSHYENFKFFDLKGSVLNCLNELS